MDDEGVSQIISLLVAGTLFVGIVGAVMMGSQQVGTDGNAAQGASQDLDVDRLLRLLVESPGVGWDAGPDHILRLGLANATGPGLDAAKLDALRGAAIQANGTNGLVDYEEALLSLGLDPNLPGGFHIRISPVDLSRLMEQEHKSHIRPAYIGDWNSLASVTIPIVATHEQMQVNAQTQVNLNMASGTQSERQAIAAMGMEFDNRVYMDGSFPLVYVNIPLLPNLPLHQYLGIPFIQGDVYPDHKGYLDNVLPGRLAQYDLLIVGSTVDQTALVGSGVRNAIHDFVLDGGTLMVFGSASQNFQWLQPIFSAGTKTANGAPQAPDLSHPLLHVPNSLDWTNYNHFNLGWDIQSQGAGAHYDDFQHVVVSGDGKDILAVSIDGAFGDGRIFLTSYRIKDVVANLGAAEGAGLLENMVVYGDRSALFLDYGAPVPRDVPVSVAVAYTSVPDPDFGSVPVRVEVLAWGT